MNLCSHLILFCRIRNKAFYYYLFIILLFKILYCTSTVYIKHTFIPVCLMTAVTGECPVYQEIATAEHCCFYIMQFHFINFKEILFLNSVHEIFI